MYKRQILDTLLQHFMPATSDYITKYFLIFFVGALFGAVYQMCIRDSTDAAAERRIIWKEVLS